MRAGEEYGFFVATKTQPSAPAPTEEPPAPEPEAPVDAAPVDAAHRRYG